MRLWRRFRAWRARRAAIRELSAMSDAQLWDLGIERDQIAPYVRGALARPAPPSQWRASATIIAFPSRCAIRCADPMCCSAA